MPGFNSGKMTTTSIFYTRGVPPSAVNFGALTCINYEMLRQVARHNKKIGRPIFSLF
jgi:hypothetical protein